MDTLLGYVIIIYLLLFEVKKKHRCYDLEAVPGEDNQYIAYVAYPLDLFEEGSVTNLFTSIVGNVFGFKALRALHLEDLRTFLQLIPKLFKALKNLVQIILIFFTIKQIWFYFLSSVKSLISNK
jgi:hypothetical protein